MTNPNGPIFALDGFLFRSGVKSMQEHCILLCNYFNYIDRLRRDRVGGVAAGLGEDVLKMCKL
jgi:hypothetical protein